MITLALSKGRIFEETLPLLRAAGTNSKHPLSKRCETAMAVPLDPSSDSATVETRQQLTRAMGKLDALLDKDFRIRLDPPATLDRENQPIE